MNRIAKRYAQALFLIAQQNNCLNDYEQQLRECASIIQSSETMYTILSNPENGHAMKANLLDRLFENSIDEKILSFLKLLIDKNRLDLLSDIIAEYRQEVHTISKTLDVTAVSAFPLTENEIIKIKSKLIDMYNIHDINLSFEIDNSLLGGFKLIIGNEIIDNSVKGMMDTLKNQVIAR